MAARLQAATTSGKPVMFSMDDDAGHGGLASTRNQRQASMADAMAFALWQFGVPEFQPTGSPAVVRASARWWFRGLSDTVLTEKSVTLSEIPGHADQYEWRCDELRRQQSPEPLNTSAWGRPGAQLPAGTHNRYPGLLSAAPVPSRVRERGSISSPQRQMPNTVSEPALARHRRLDVQRFNRASQLTTTVIGGAFGSLALIAAKKRWPFDAAT
jgi:hypothetical protein